MTVILVPVQDRLVLDLLVLVQECTTYLALRRGGIGSGPCGLGTEVKGL